MAGDLTLAKVASGDVYMAALVVALCLLLQVEPAQATSAQAAPVQAVAIGPPTDAPTPSAPSKIVRLAAGTLLEVELVSPLSSATSHLGDRFALRLAAPISDNGVELVAAGAIGEGEVIDAAHAGMAGRAGKLILSARHLELNGRPTRIRALTLITTGQSGIGQSRVGLATGVMLLPYVGPTAVLIRGGEVEIPAGAHYTVKLAEDVDLQSNPSNPSEDERK